jgi:hypothetical protein
VRIKVWVIDSLHVVASLLAATLNNEIMMRNTNSGYRVNWDIYIYSIHKWRSWHGLTTPPFFLNFLFTNLFSIKFLYFFIISSLFPYFNLFVSIFIQSYINIKLHVSTLLDTNNRICVFYVMKTSKNACIIRSECTHYAYILLCKQTFQIRSVHNNTF